MQVVMLYYFPLQSSCRENSLYQAMTQNRMLQLIEL